MQDTVYLIFNKSGVTGYRKTKPALKSGEYAVKMNVSVPAKFFDRAIPEANLEIPEGYYQEPPVEVSMEDMEPDYVPEPQEHYEEQALEEAGL